MSLESLPDVPQDFKDLVDDILFVFDFDGTLVPDTKYVDDNQNIINFETFKTLINPDAYKVHWAIVTSRPAQDLDLLKGCLKRNNMFPTDGIITQKHGIPDHGNDTEVAFKVESINSLWSKYRGVIYVDNDLEMNFKITSKDENITAMTIFDFMLMLRHRAGVK